MNDELHSGGDELLDDELASLLTGAVTPTVNAVLRTSLLVQTTSLIRRRARRKRALKWGSVFGAYALGLATALLMFNRESAPNQRTPGRDARRIAEKVESPSAAGAHGGLALAKEQEAVDPAVLRRRVAAAPRDEQIRLLAQAGDLYLARFDDLESALDCYRQVLELAPDNASTQPDSDDSWLLAELKAAHHRAEIQP